MWEARRTMTTAFAALGVPDVLAASLERRGITEPFPIQIATIPDALGGRDICGRAPTGSGKTIAFALPLVAGLPDRPAQRPLALVLVPTRELCAQVADEIAPLARARGASVVSIYGGVSERTQRRALSAGASVVIACPGRLEDLLSQGALRLDDVRHVVIDEADRMADMGFLPAVQRILDATSPDRQTQLFSATLGGPVATLIKRYQVDPARHDVGSREVHVIDAASHSFWKVERADRAQVTAELIARSGSTVVFTRTRHGATRLTKQLAKLGVSAVELHGGRSQPQRDRALESFSQGRSAALVATDVAARGIHVDDVACVVHYDLPADADTYVHRSGRTARAGSTGSVVTLVEPQSRGEAAKLQRALGLPTGLDTPTRGGAPAPTRAPAAATRTREQRPAGREQKRQSDTGQKARARRQTSTPAPTTSRDGDRRRHQGGRSGVPARSSRSPIGEVKFFNEKMGYGFIAREREADLFVHHTNILGEGFRSLRQGQRVEFAVGQGRKGDEAVDVRVV
jgi:superfamily II DNA/RNA helicase